MCVCLQGPHQAAETDHQGLPLGLGERGQQPTVVVAQVIADPPRRHLPGRGQGEPVEAAIVGVAFASDPAPLHQPRHQAAHRALLQAEPTGQVLLGQRFAVRQSTEGEDFGHGHPQAAVVVRRGVRLQQAPRARASMFGLAHRPHGYLTFAAHLAGPLYDRVTADVAAHPLPPQARVLDAGTGPGVLPLKIATARPGLLLDAVDLSPEMIEEARRNAERSGRPEAVTFTVADVTRLPFPDATFDLVVSTISQHHWQDPAAGLQDILRVLRPGGRAWVYDFRLALRRARRAATTLPEGVTVTVESPLPGARWLSPIGRLVLIAGGTPQP